MTHKYTLFVCQNIDKTLVHSVWQSEGNIMAKKTKKKGKPLKGRPPSLRDQLKSEKARQEMMELRRKEREPTTVKLDPNRWHRDNSVKTILSAIIGIMMGVAFASAVGDATGTSFSIWAMLLFVFFLSYAQKLMYPVLGVNIEKFRIRDWLFTIFMTFAFWLITWTILIN